MTIRASCTTTPSRRWMPLPRQHGGGALPVTTLKMTLLASANRAASAVRHHIRSSPSSEQFIETNGVCLQSRNFFTTCIVTRCTAGVLPMLLRAFPPQRHQLEPRYELWSLGNWEALVICHRRAFDITQHVPMMAQLNTRSLSLKMLY